MPKILDILKKRQEEHKDKDVPLFSFEYYPPKTPAGVISLYKRVWRMNKQGPLFCDLTWGAGGSTSDLTLEMTRNLQQNFGAEMNMHLTCTNIHVDSVKKALADASAAGIRNIVSLRGDPPAGEEKWAATEGGFDSGLSLTDYITKTHPSQFGLAVAGYPEGHPNAIKEVEDLSVLTVNERARMSFIDGKHYVCYDADFEKEMAYLKKKVDAGGDVIMTQLFYDIDVFLDFVRKCREIGITVPIFPGIMPIANRGGFKRMGVFCKTRVPYEIRTCLDACKDDVAFKKLGHEIMVDICKKIWKSGTVPLLHFFTLNLENATYGLMEALGIKVIDPVKEFPIECEKAYAKCESWVKVPPKGEKDTKEPDPKKAKTASTA